MKDTMQFLDLLETYRHQDASIEALFGDAGRSIRAGRAQNPVYARKLAEAAALMDRAMKSRRHAYMLQEALTTSDFPQLFGDVIDRSVLANYMETPQTFRQWCKIATVPDFRAVKRFRIDGGETYLAEVKQSAPYPESSVTDDQYTYTVKKYGRRMPFSWETMINDDLQALRDVPMRFGRAARRSEERFATSLIAGSTGPDGTLYAAGNKNIVNTTNGASSTNPALSIVGLQDAWTVLGNMVDSGGDPITVDAVILLVPPALEVVANNILRGDRLIIGADSAAQRVNVDNWMRGRVTIAVNPYLPLISSSSNGATSWYLFNNPNNGRPAVEIGFLRGHETPELFMKAPNATRIGGGGEDPMNGDFDTDSIEYKVRHVFGGATMDPKMTVASNGSGS